MAASRSGAPAAACQLQPERVLGLSTPSHGAIACRPGGDLLACASGCFTVVQSVATRQQTHLLRSSSSNRRVACVAWAPDGQHLAAGEAGSGACVLVWQLGGCGSSDSSSSRCMHELKAHKHTVTVVRFSPDGRLLLSAGAAPDGLLALWDWQAGALLWKQQLGADISSATFTEDGSHALALGRSFFKAWSLSCAAPQQPSRARASGASGAGAAITLTPRPVKLKDHAAAAFVDVLQAPSLPGQPPGSNGVYALAQGGVLVLMRPTGRVVDRAVNLQVRAAFGLAAVPTQVAAACADGVVRLFSSKTLAFRATLPRFVARGAGSSAQFPDAHGASFCQAGSQLAVAYADRSVLLWDVQDAKQISCVSSLLCAHSSCVWGVVPVGSPQLPPEEQQPRCATCAADGTLRLWNLAEAAAPGQQTGRLLEGMIAAGPTQPPGASSPPPGVQLRCIAVSPDGRELCVGDQHGSLHVYDAASLQLLTISDAHDGEVLCIEYTAAPRGAATTSGAWAASGGRDGLIHVFDAAAGWQLLDTLDEHDAAVTALRFVSGGSRLVSCGADGSIVFRELGSADGGAPLYCAYHVQTLPRSLLFDVAVDPLGSYVLSTGQDGLRQWDVASGELLRTLQAEPGAGEPVRLCIDPGGVVAVCCHADGCLRLYELRSGQLLWRAWGHGDIAAAAALTPDLTRLVSVGGDGLVIVWRLPDQLVADMRAAVARVAAAQQHLLVQSAKQRPAQQQQQHSPVPVCAGDAATPAAAAWALGGVSSTPGSDSGSSVLLRIRQGRPLVSIDKLPRWARSPSSPAASSSDGGSSTHASGRAPLLSRFFSGRGVAKGKWQASQLLPGEPDLLGTADSCSSALGSINNSSSPALLGMGSGPQPLDMTASMTLDDHNQQPQWPSWSLEGDVMVAPADGWEASAGTEGTGGTQVPAAEAAAATQPSAPGSAGDVVRDLFREHFSTGVHSTPAMEQHAHSRQSMSTLFKRNRASLCGQAQPSSQLAAAPCSSSATAATACDAASPAAEVVATAAQQQQQQQQRRWRHGQMDDELAGMRERLEGLQALYQQQLAQTKLSPRSRSSKSLPGLHEPLSSSEQPAAAKQGSRQQSGVAAVAAPSATGASGVSGRPAAMAASAGGAAPTPRASPARAPSGRAGSSGGAEAASSPATGSTPTPVCSTRSPGPASVHSNHSLLAQLLSCDSPEPPMPVAAAPAGASPVQHGTTHREPCDSALRVSIGTCIAAADVEAATSDAGTPLSAPDAAAPERQPSRTKQQQRQPPALAPGSIQAAGGGGALPVSAAAAGAGATVTPHGQHVMWPGWGPDGTWEGGTPSPASSLQSWGAAAGAAPPAGASAGVLPDGCGAGAAPEFRANPCFDMTPLSSTPGSTWQSSKQLGADAAAPAADADADARVRAVPQQVIDVAAPSSSHDGSSSPAQVQQRQGVATSSACTLQHGCSSPRSSSSSAKKSRAQLKQEKQAAKAAARAAASSSSAGDGSASNTPGGMLGLLSRMTRTLPGIRSRGASQAGAAEAAASPGTRLHEPAAPQHQLQPQQQQQVVQAGSLSVDNVMLEVPAQHSHGSDAASEQQQQQQRRGAAAKRRSAVELAACVDRFRQCTQELQQLWQELQVASMDADAASELQQLLTPQRATAASTAAPLGNGIAAATPPTALKGRIQQQGSSGTEQPAVMVRQQLQQELLHTISSLHAAVAGGAPGSVSTASETPGSAATGSPIGTPPWSRASPLHPRAGAIQQQQQQQQQARQQPRTLAAAWR